MEALSTSDRILEATREVLARSGTRKLSLSDVAAEAGVSRPTLYRWFPSKQELLVAFGRYEQSRFDAAIQEAIDGYEGQERLERALQVVVAFQTTPWLRRMLDVEPEHLLREMARALPSTRAQLEPYFTGPDGPTVAAIVARVALSHALLPDEDPDVLLHDLRAAAGLRPVRRRSGPVPTGRRSKGRSTRS